MSAIVSKFKHKYAEYASAAKGHSKSGGIAGFLHYLHMTRKYHVKLDDYFANELYHSCAKSREYLSNNNQYKRKWAIVSKKCMPDATSWWLLTHKIDYLFARLMYPGLDAMDYFHYEFYHFRHEKRRTFITDGYLAKMDRRFNRDGRREMLAEKSKFNDLFKDIVVRKWLLTRGMTREALEDFFTMSHAIAKPLDGAQGTGIFLVDRQEQSLDEIFSLLHDKNYILEELVVQHRNVASLNPSSVNTIRIYSVFYQNAVHLTSSVIRIGRGNGPTDNYSAGGMAAAVDLETGIVISGAIDKDNHVFYSHPVTKRNIIGFQIPEWERVKQTVRTAHMRIQDLRYVAWDVVVCEDGSVTFLEANTGGGVNLQQHPLLTGKKLEYQKYL